MFQPRPAIDYNLQGQIIKKKPQAKHKLAAIWQRRKDSNPHKRSQSPVCYLYTTPLNASVIIYIFLFLSTPFSIFSFLFTLCEKHIRSARAYIVHYIYFAHP